MVLVVVSGDLEAESLAAIRWVWALFGGSSSLTALRAQRATVLAGLGLLILWLRQPKSQDFACACVAFL